MKIEALKSHLAIFDEIVQPFIASEHGQKIGFATFILMLALACATLFSVLKNSWAVATLQATPVVKAVEISANDSHPPLANLSNQHLFGQAVDGELPITSLQFHLTGILKATQGGMSKAIISVAGKPGKVYSVGDLLPSGIKVYAVTNDEVVLERSGHLEKLPLGRTPLVFQGMPQGLQGDSQ